MSEYLCAWLPAFRLQAAAGRLPKEAAIAVEREGPLELVAVANAGACAAGIHARMAVSQALGRCPGVGRWPCSDAAEHELALQLRNAADRISPRVQMVSPDLLVLDFAGLERLHKSSEAAAQHLEEDFAHIGVWLSTGIAAQPATALMAAKSGIRRMVPGQESSRLAPLPVTLLSGLQELICTLATVDEVEKMLALLDRWGIRTLGALAALPRAALSARLGRIGVHLQALARGEVTGILNTPPQPDLTLSRVLAFDPPVYDLETAKAAIAREVESLIPELERHDQVVERVELRLTLEAKKPEAVRGNGETPGAPAGVRGRGSKRALPATNGSDPGKKGRATKPEAVYVWPLAVPTREERVLVAQLHLDLDRDPPGSNIENFQLTLHLARPRRIQTRLFAAVSPDRAKLTKLLARLAEIFHDRGADRVGTPRLLDTHRPQAFDMHTFAPPDDDSQVGPAQAAAQHLALRIFRPPQVLRDHQARVVRRAGPWRSAGGWWRERSDAAQWTWDEWDAEIEMPGGRIGLYRLLHDLATKQWYILGRYD